MKRLFLLTLLLAGCGAPPSPPVTSTFAVTGMTCNACESTIEAKISRLPGVVEVKASGKSGEAVVTYDPAALKPEAIAAAVRSAGYGAELSGK